MLAGDLILCRVASMLPRALSVLLILCTCLSLARAESPAAIPFKVGIGIPLSGAVKFLGDNTLMGVTLYQEQHPAFRQKIALHIEDTTAATAAGVSAVKKLIEIDSVDALVLEVSPVVNAVAPLIDREGIPTIAIVGDDCSKGRKFMVKLWLPASHEAQAVAMHLKALGITSLAIVYAEQDSMLARTTALKQLLPATMTIYDASIGTNDELAIAATRIAAFAPQALIMNLMPGQNAIFARRLAELRYSGHRIATGIVADIAEQTAAAGTLAGTKYPDVGIDKNFVQAFRLRFGAAHPPIGAANGYDAMKLLDHALADLTYPYDKSRINARLRVRDFEGALGKYSFSFDEMNTYLLPAVMREVGP